MNNSNDHHKSLFENIPVVDLKTVDIERTLANIINEDIAEKIEGIIIGKPSEDKLVLAVKDPTQLYIYMTQSNMRQRIDINRF